MSTVGRVVPYGKTVGQENGQMDEHGEANCRYSKFRERT